MCHKLCSNLNFNLISAPLLAAGHSLQIEAAPNLTLHTVPEALTEALTRILANVLDHAFADKEKGVLTIRARRSSEVEAGTAATEGAVQANEAQEGIIITINDNGCGIAAADLPKVLDPFFTTKSGIGGHVGLGLHVAFNHITQRLKGKLGVASVEGEGTTVTICLNHA